MFYPWLSYLEAVLLQMSFVSLIWHQIISSSREKKDQAYVVVTFVSLVWGKRIMNTALLYLVCSKDALKCYFKIVFIYNIFLSRKKL